ncbi:MAG: hypothetical protein EOO52_17715 [Gammaproteobacteria bacterium]|nr:MAG: hypothetical protein EOO52_17715 [Gammaproteobacteria bacterium]
MKYFLMMLALTPLLTLAAEEQPLTPNSPLVYVNQNIGFNVKGFKYKQSEFPCNIDKAMVEDLVDKAKTQGLRFEPVSTAAKIRNGVVPVLLIDVEQLVLGSEHQFGTKQSSALPKIQITAALLKGKEMATAKHTCAIMSLNEFTPSSNVLDLGSNGVTVCDATQKCLKDLSKDVVEWIEPQIR